MPSRRSTPRRGRSSSVISNDAESAPSSSAAAARASKAATAAAAAAAASCGADRPELPKGTNSALPQHDVPVKLQIIEREGKDIIIGRVKLPLPEGSTPDHAFLLKRFDTNALAASSMFKIAFPYASPEQERTEMDYLERSFNCDIANGGLVSGSAADEVGDAVNETPTKRKPGRPRKSAPAAPTHAGTGVRLQGTWIPAADAHDVAEEYRILKYARNLISARAELDENRQLFLVLEDGSRIPQAASKRAAANRNGAANGAGAGSAAGEGATDTPRRKRARQSEPASSTVTTTTTTATTAAGETTPSVVRTKTIRTVAADGTEEVRVEQTSTSVISAEEANAQLEQARALAISKRAEAAAAGSTSTSSRKRRAVADAPRSGAAAAGEEDEYAADGTMVPSGALVTTVRRGARAVRRRPIVSAAGLVGATAAAGAGALAYASGGDLQTAIQLAQQGLASLGLSGLSGIFHF